MGTGVVAGPIYHKKQLIMTERDTLQSEDALTALENRDFVPVLNEVVPSSEEELLNYRKKLRQYFLQGKKTEDSCPSNVVPVLLTTMLQRNIESLDYPILCNEDNRNLTNLYNILHKLILDHFNKDDANILIDNLPRMISQAQEKAIEEDAVRNYELVVNDVFESFTQNGSQSGENASFLEQCEQIKIHLLEKSSTVIDFSKSTVFQILNWQLKNRKERNQTFLKTLKKSISGLNEILLLHMDEKGSPQDHFDFAEELISFDKIQDMAPAVVSSSLPEARLNRLRQCYQTLSEAHKSYSKSCCTIFASQKLAEEFVLNKIMDQATLEVTSKGSCAKAREYYKNEIRSFVQIIAALRLADLEIKQQYNEDLHNSYFAGFALSHLSDDDIRNFHSLIVVEESRNLTQQPKDFLALLLEGAFANVLAINRFDEISGTFQQNDLDETYLELAALAIFRRNTCVFQGGADTPDWLNESLQKGLDAPCPTLWNILISKPEPNQEHTDILSLKIAIESRYFPRLVYNLQSGDDFGSHFDLSENPQPEQQFSSYQQEILVTRKKKIENYHLSTADFLAFSPDNCKLLEIVPSRFWHKELIPLAEYLTLPADAQDGKVPFIWVVDEQNTLQKAAIPVSWLQRCRARLDYWLFLQELGGVNSNRIRHTLEEAKSQWETSKETEIEEIKAQLLTEFESTRTDDLEKAIRRILNALIDGDQDFTKLQQPSSITTIPTGEASKTEHEPELDQTGEIIKPTIQSNVWVESDECTSCSDCIDALPSVFKYNSDKLAYVHNPKGSTYAQIVKTAEKCPARCIHPGLPHDSSEPGLEKLIKRAEKYN